MHLRPARKEGRARRNHLYLEPAHEHPYKRVVELVRLLREVLPTGEFAEVMHDIRTRYGRRGKLMGMLAGV